MKTVIIFFKDKTRKPMKYHRVRDIYSLANFVERRYQVEIDYVNLYDERTKLFLYQHKF